MMDFDLRILGDVSLRLACAALAGGLLGLNRELSHHFAGLRTHVVVSLGSAAFVILGHYVADDDPNAAARVVQGVAAGIGFLGAGTILKLDTHREIKGLTTAGTIWLAAALGAAAGLAHYELLAACTAIGLALLTVLRPLKSRIGEAEEDEKNHKAP